MNTPPTEEPIHYYPNRAGAAAWLAIVVTFGVISVGSSLAAQSLVLTAFLLPGAIAIACLGYWALAKSRFFISSTSVGFKDAFRSREVQFDEILFVTRPVRNNSRTLSFVCNTRTVAMPLDPLDQAWFPAVKAELHKRGIPVSYTGCITRKKK